MLIDYFHLNTCFVGIYSFLLFTTGITCFVLIALASNSINKLRDFLEIPKTIKKKNN